jgi:hypothetical protein
MENEIVEYKNLVRKRRRKRCVGDRVVDERIILKWIFKMLSIRMWTRFIWHMIGYSDGHL